MKPLSFMLIAGEPSGDANAAALVEALCQKVIARSSNISADVQPLRTALAPRFFGAGGPKMAAADVELAFDLTQHSVIGISEVVKKYFQFRQMFNQLLRLAIERQPDVIIGVDYGGFNLRFGKAIKDYVRKHRSEFTPWNPKIVQFVSPQVWASRPARAYTLASNYDLLLSIFPFEKDWYARRVPDLRVAFVGHPMVRTSPKSKVQSSKSAESRRVVLLPGSRADEVRRHLAVMTQALEHIRHEIPNLRAEIVLPSEQLIEQAVAFSPSVETDIRLGHAPDALADVDLAITKSGTVTMECAFHGVPAVVLYKTSWPTYWIAKQVLTVNHLAMPNILAGEEIYPEFIQDAATPENIARAALKLLGDETQRKAVQSKLAQVVASLGKPGAVERAADAILSLLP